VHFATNVPFPAVVQTHTAPKSPVVASFAPEPFVSGDEAAKGLGSRSASTRCGSSAS
jgi:hypothetical protein